ncbi:MAG: hypothetical protein ABIR19_04865 [Ginsengibacter sp.]
MKIFMLISMIFSLSIVSCKKGSSEKAANPSFITFNSEGLAYVQLPVNHYYIFKDSASGMLDSVVVSQSTLEQKFSPESVDRIAGTNVKTPAHYYQNFKLQLSSISGNTQKAWFYGAATNKPDFIIGDYLNSDTAYLSLLESDVNFTGEAFAYPESYQFAPQSSSKIIPAMTVVGTSYSNVINFISANSADPTDKNFVRATYFWAKNIGIIKREIKTPTTVKTESLLRHG